MTALPLRLKWMFARDPMRSRLKSVWHGVLAFVTALALLALGPASAARADDPIKGEVKAVLDGGYLRLMFQFDEAVEATTRVSGAIIVISFNKPVAVAVERLNVNAPEYVSAARRDPDGSAIRIALTRKVKLNTITAAERLYVDILPENWKGPMPGLPQEVIDELVRRARDAERQLHQQRAADRQKKPAVVRVKVANQPTFVRYVFTMPGTVNVVPERADGRLTLNFDQQVAWDLADAKASLPPTLKAIEAEVDFDSVAVVFTLNGSPDVRAFREDRNIVVDIGVDGAKPKQSGEGGAAKQTAKSDSAPAVSPPETMPPKNSPADMLPKISASSKTESAAAPSAPAPTPAKEAEQPKAAPEPAPQIAPTPPKKTEQSQPPSSPPKEAEQPQPKPTMAAAAPEKPQPAPAAATAPAAAATSDPPAPVVETLPSAVPPAPSSAPPSPKKIFSGSTPSDDSLRPKANPNAVVVARAQQSGDKLRVELPFAAPTPAAAFQRAETLWLVFDSAAQIDLTALQADGDNGVREILSERSDDGAVIVRIKLARPRMVSLEADGPGWIANIADTATAQTRPLAIARSIVGKNRASIAVPFEGASAIHNVKDPDIDDRLMVITALGPARGFLKVQDFVELRALPSAHGVVIQPIADDITAELGSDKITIGRPAGLTLSATALGQQQVAVSFRAFTFDTQVWGFDRDAPFNARQSELIGLAASAPVSKRRQARLNLARFYLAKDMAPEAKAVLNVALADQRASDDVTGSVLTAVADVMLDRPEDALKELSKPQVGNQQDAPIWRAIALARQGRWAEAQDIFRNVTAAIGALPIELQRMAMKEALRSSIELRDFNNATRLVNDFETVGVTPDLEPTINVLLGRLYEGLGRTEDALASYRAAAMSSDRRAAAQGRLREIVLAFATGGMGRKDVINDIETLTTVWRGDETETEGLKVLAHLYTEDSRYRDAFHTMRTALLAHPNSDMTRKIQDEAAITFENLFLGGKGDALAPVEALGLFYDFRELTPIGRRGDEMIRRLSDRLVGVDLLDQAADLLQHQVDHRLQGAARAQVAARLAVVYLMNRKPDRALAILQSTRVSDLSNDLRDQRLLLEARAMSNLGRHDLALELIANINSREASRLRSDVLWAAKRWRESGEQIELLYGDRWRQFAPLDDNERSDILRAAIGYAIGEESIGLVRLREKYEAKFADGPDRRAFNVVTAPTGPNGVEFQDIAKKVASVDTLDAFLRDLRTRYPDAAAVSPGGAAGDGAVAAPAAPAANATPDTAGKAGSATSDAASSPRPPKPATGPADKEPTGSITPLPKARARAR
ncbi:MAG TPA: tetratricopeptide repeat protein [Pseudolabrys sp.]|nr:tetratricopeptide repeat protein [Pseudolabrys sp.]